METQWTTRALGLGWQFFQMAAAYLVLLIAYSAVLKHLVILDVLTISAGFTLRAAAGGAAIAVPVSHWLLVCTSLLALFMALSKRRHELVLLADGAGSHRPILQEYSPYLLDQMIGVVTASTLVSYVVYTISAETVQTTSTARRAVYSSHRSSAAINDTRYRSAQWEIISRATFARASICRR